MLDFDGDLYDQHAEVRFVDRIRGEERFDSVDALVAQMQPRRRGRPGGPRGLWAGRAPPLLTKGTPGEP